MHFFRCSGCDHDLYYQSNTTFKFPVALTGIIVSFFRSRDPYIEENDSTLTSGLCHKQKPCFPRNGRMFINIPYDKA